METSSRLPPYLPTTFKKGYFFQALVWVLIERALGFNFNFFKLLLIGFWLFVNSVLWFWELPLWVYFNLVFCFCFIIWILECFWAGLVAYNMIWTLCYFLIIKKIGVGYGIWTTRPSPVVSNLQSKLVWCHFVFLCFFLPFNNSLLIGSENHSGSC